MAAKTNTTINGKKYFRVSASFGTNADGKLTRKYFYGKSEKEARKKMEEYKLTLGMEPTDDYKKAKQDLIQAMRSIQKLSPQQQQMLAEELFGAANVMVLSQILRQYLR